MGRIAAGVGIFVWFGAAEVGAAEAAGRSADPGPALYALLFLAIALAYWALRTARSPLWIGLAFSVVVTGAVGFFLVASKMALAVVAMERTLAFAVDSGAWAVAHVLPMLVHTGLIGAGTLVLLSLARVIDEMLNPPAVLALKSYPVGEANRHDFGKGVVRLDARKRDHPGLPPSGSLVRVASVDKNGGRKGICRVLKYANELDADSVAMELDDAKELIPNVRKGDAVSLTFRRAGPFSLVSFLWNHVDVVTRWQFRISTAIAGLLFMLAAPGG